MICVGHCDTPLGGVTLAAEGEALIGLWFDGQAHFGEGLPDAREAREHPVLDAARRWLEVYFAGRDPGFAPPLAPRGTPFRRAVWERLRTIPFGETMTYGALAAALGLPRAAARAIGGAVARNPVSLIIPCHRVVGACGALTGYAGGLGRKARLLALERGGRA